VPGARRIEDGDVNGFSGSLEKAKTLTENSTPMVDPFGRAITYLRVSVTDRCDFRCTYCMSEHMTFLPKKDLLTLEELDRLCSRTSCRWCETSAGMCAQAPSPS
jgi:GTP 3',8-cyclase